MQLVPVSRSSIPVKTDRGGQMQVLLSPRTVETKTGFMGTLVLAPGDVYKKHYHPYSDEYIYVIEGEITISEEANAIVAQAGTAVFIPKNVPHRLKNTTSRDSLVIFFSCPLAPQPNLGHVTLED